MWTNVSKPTGANYTKVNVMGRQPYDDAGLIYDDPNAFYDSVNINAYTNIPKPTGYTVILAGMATGVLGPPTYSKMITAGRPWVNVNKPS